MKTLLVLRHAKAEAASVGQLDVDRGLTNRGKTDADRVGQLLAQTARIPDSITTSAARRTRKTAKRVAEHSGFKGEIAQTDDLYDAGIEQIAAVIRTLPADAATSLIVGHNPGFWDLVATCGKPISDFPPASLAELKLPIETWSEFTTKTRGELASLWTPNDVSPSS